MKKPIVILILCIIQGACAGTEALMGGNPPATGSQQIAAEISVRHELLDPTTDVETITARTNLRAIK